MNIDLTVQKVMKLFRNLIKYYDSTLNPELFRRSDLCNTIG